MKFKRLRAGLLASAIMGACPLAYAQTANDATSATSPAPNLQELSARLRKEEKRAKKDRQELAVLRAQVEALSKQSNTDLDSLRAGQEPSTASTTSSASSNAGNSLPAAPVGEKPTEQPVLNPAPALPEGINVLAAPGSFVITPSAEYTRASSNRLVFRGVEIVPGIQLGLIDANTVASDLAVGAIDARVGLFNRFEAEVRVPYTYQHQSLTTVSQQVVSGTPGVTQTTNLAGSGLGDIELTGRYQINSPVEEAPIYIASIRYKSDTGRGPFDVNFDSSGVATSLATGTGFTALGPGLTVIVPSDPALLFANFGYLHSFARNIDKTIGTTHVGEVAPGDSLDMALGFGLALNSRFSISLGYSHNMIFPTSTELGTTKQVSNTLQAGSLTMGLSYQLNEHFALNTNFQFGVTSDAPNLLITFRVPFTP